MQQKLDRTTFSTSRLLDFCSRKELIAQTGHEPDAWPLVALKELADNALDACEEVGVSPEVSIHVSKAGITVADNGPGLPAETVNRILDFSIRVSRREAYVSPDRGAQGNALKTILAMPFVLDGESGLVEIAAKGVRHRIRLGADRIRQRPVVEHDAKEDAKVNSGTAVTVHWPDSACSILEDSKERFLQIAEDYAWLNPHLTLSVDWFGDSTRLVATGPGWKKWCSSDPTCAHWYDDEHFTRLIAGYVSHDEDHGADRTVRDFVAEFRGLSGSAKQKIILGDVGLARQNLSSLVNGNGLATQTISRLLASMKTHTKPVKPVALGVIGKDHFSARVEAAGADMDTFQYRRTPGETDDVPYVIETVFAYCPDAESRRLVTGVNWSPGIVNPFRSLGKIGESLDGVLSGRYAGRNEPIILVLHAACARVEYTDRGKSAVVVQGDYDGCGDDSW